MQEGLVFFLSSNYRLSFFDMIYEREGGKEERENFPNFPLHVDLSTLVTRPPTATATAAMT